MLVHPVLRVICAVFAALVWMATAVTAQESNRLDGQCRNDAIGEDPERPDAELFHVDYIKDGAAPATRPVTFL